MFGLDLVVVEFSGVLVIVYCGGIVGGGYMLCRIYGS